jgi:hypothetical protein
LSDDVREKTARDSEIEDCIAQRGVLGLRRVKCHGDVGIEFGLGDITLKIRHPLRQPVPHRLVDPVDAELGVIVADEAGEHGVQAALPAARRIWREIDADDSEVLRQHTRPG